MIPIEVRTVPFSSSYIDIIILERHEPTRNACKLALIAANDTEGNALAKSIKATERPCPLNALVFISFMII